MLCISIDSTLRHPKGIAELYSSENKKIEYDSICMEITLKKSFHKR